MRLICESLNDTSSILRLIALIFSFVELISPVISPYFSSFFLYSSFFSAFFSICPCIYSISFFALFMTERCAYFAAPSSAAIIVSSRLSTPQSATTILDEYSSTASFLYGALLSLSFLKCCPSILSLLCNIRRLELTESPFAPLISNILYFFSTSLKSKSS